MPFAVQLIPGGLIAFGCFVLRVAPLAPEQLHREEALRNPSRIRDLAIDHEYLTKEVAAMDK